MMFKILVLIFFVGIIFFSYNIGYGDGQDDCMCIIKQNYLSTPYLANPNNLERKDVLVIKEIDDLTKN